MPFQSGVVSSFGKKGIRLLQQKRKQMKRYGMLIIMARIVNSLRFVRCLECVKVASLHQLNFPFWCMMLLFESSCIFLGSFVMELGWALISLEVSVFEQSLSLLQSAAYAPVCLRCCCISLLKIFLSCFPTCLWI